MTDKRSDKRYMGVLRQGESRFVEVDADLVRSANEIGVVFGRGSLEALARAKEALASKAPDADDAPQASAEEQAQREAEQRREALGQFFGKVLSHAREPLAKMSPSALEAFDQQLGIHSTGPLDTSGLKATTASLENAKRALDELIGANSLSVGRSASGQWMVETALKSQRLQVEFLGQKKQLQELMAGYEDGSVSLQSFISAGKGASGTMRLLDDQDLGALNRKVREAEERMKALGEKSRATLEAFQDQLLRLQGKDDQVGERGMDRQARTLREQLADARRQGDQTSVYNLTQSLQTLDEIRAETQRVAQVNARNARAAELAKAAAPMQAPTQIIRLETATGKRVDVSVPGESDKTALLDILADAGLRTL